MTMGMKDTLSLGLFLLCMICSTQGVRGRPVGAEELREERLAILRRIIEDMRQLIYVNDLYEESTGADDIDLNAYLDSLTENTKGTDKRMIPGGFSAVRGKRPHTFSAVRGKRPHTFSAVRGKRDPPPPMFFKGFKKLTEDSDKRNAAPAFSFVRGKKDLENVKEMIPENAIVEDESVNGPAENSGNPASEDSEANQAVSGNQNIGFVFQR